jgi:hypothetical protein
MLCCLRADTNHTRGWHTWVVHLCGWVAGPHVAWRRVATVRDGNGPIQASAVFPTSEDSSRSRCWRTSPVTHRPDYTHSQHTLSLPFYAPFSTAFAPAMVWVLVLTCTFGSRVLALPRAYVPTCTCGLRCAFLLRSTTLVAGPCRAVLPCGPTVWSCRCGPAVWSYRVVLPCGPLAVSLCGAPQRHGRTKADM